MAGLCEGGNEPPGSLKASNCIQELYLLQQDPRAVAVTAASKSCSSYSIIKELWLLQKHQRAVAPAETSKSCGSCRSIKEL
ncbi:hypothetical protein ANN_20922 [Periplaneta americana]|uniref:Uncharacterized protein n=1 Tax=Periplaneta americana TaxID=6978 RepID=A0ABQ8SE91_PERAM|nr:hypothetical protein ANN_20922 [Periplaneta americana]